MYHYQSCHKIKRTENFSICTKNGGFFSAASCKKDTIFGKARKTIGPDYFVTTSERKLYILFIQHGVGPTKIGPKNHFKRQNTS